MLDILQTAVRFANNVWNTYLLGIIREQGYLLMEPCCIRDRVLGSINHHFDRAVIMIIL